MRPEAVTRSLHEFLVVYIHAIAYVAGVYPQESFALRQQYDTATYENNHPGVKLWVENAVKSVMELIYSSSSSARKATVSVIILENSEPIERFGIAISNFEVQPNVLQSQVSQQDLQADLVDVSGKFRSCVARLYASTPASSRRSNDADRSMTIMFEGELDSASTPNAWMTVEQNKRGIHSRIYPIRSIEIEDEDEQLLVLNTFRQVAR